MCSASTRLLSGRKGLLSLTYTFSMLGHHVIDVLSTERHVVFTYKSSIILVRGDGNFRPIDKSPNVGSI